MLSLFGAGNAKRSASQTTRKLRVEPLERREVMASNFTATLVAGNLSIIGSADHDSLSITQLNGNLLVAASGRINGGNTVRTFSGVNNLFISMGGGTDAVGIGRVNLPGNLTIDTDFNANAGQGVPGNTAAQDRTDAVSLGTVRIGGNLNITTGGGNDSVSLGQVAINRNTNINLGDGHDGLSMGLVSVRGNTVIDAGAGNDAVVIASSSFTGTVNVFLGAGDDSIVIVNSRFGSLTTINGGTGADRRTISGNSFALAPVFVSI
jgi:hypothetical protein